MDERVHIIRGPQRSYVLVHQPTLDELGPDGFAAELTARDLRPNDLGVAKLHPNKFPPRQFWTIPILKVDE